MAKESGSNLEVFIEAGMLDRNVRTLLKPPQVEAIESWDRETVDLIIRLYKQTGRIECPPGVCWI